MGDETIPRRVRAVWSPDYSAGAIPGHPNPPFDPTSLSAPFRMSLDPDDRDQIVRLSSDFTLSLSAAKVEPYIPISIAADKVYLSSLGAWVDVFGDWPDPLPFGPNAVFSVEQWQHRAAMARDNYVRVVYAGYLLPFGNAASLVKVTEHKLQSINGGPATAYLRQRFFIIVREPVKSFDSLTDPQRRSLPFQSINITTLVTPDVSPALDASQHYAFFPTNGANSFLFHIVGTDWEGQTSEFTAPLYFVERGGDYSQAVIAYNTSGTGNRGLAGQKVAFAPHNKSGDTTFHASTLESRHRRSALRRSIRRWTAPTSWFPPFNSSAVVRVRCRLCTMRHTYRAASILPAVSIPARYSSKRPARHWASDSTANSPVVCHAKSDGVRAVAQVWHGQRPDAGQGRERHLQCCRHLQRRRREAFRRSDGWSTLTS
jgi:hypothetical protein